MTTDDRMAINAAINGLLTDPNDVEAANAVIQFASRLPKTKLISGESVSGSRNSNTTTAHTPEHGNVTIKTNSDEEERASSFGYTKERVGYYKVWREKETEINFQYFWKSDTSTEGISTPPPIYVLTYKEKTLEYVDLEVEGRVFIFSLGWLHIVKYVNDSLREPGKSTFAGWLILLSNRYH